MSQVASRRLLGGGAAFTLIAASVLLPPSSADAAPPVPSYATACAAPTRTISGGGSQSLQVAVGEVVLLTGGTYTGGSNDFPSGAVLCVSANATLAPSYLNNAGGAVYNLGTATFPSAAVQGSFILENEGTASFPQGVNTNGPSTLENRGTLTVGTSISISGGAQLFNDGTVTVAGGVNLNGGTVLANTGVITVNGDSTVNGVVANTGNITVTGRLTVNGGSTLTNSCRLTVGSDLTNGGALNNSGVISDLTGQLQNNGRLRQDPPGVTVGRDFGNDQSVTGYGRYRFSGTTKTQGTFVGDSPSAPIVVQDLTPTAGRIFDTQNGTVANAVSGTVSDQLINAQPVDCAGATPSADLQVSKTGQSTTSAGATVSYSVVATNAGPGTALGVIVQDLLPPNLVNPVASDGGVIASGVATWSIGSMANGSTRTFTISGTAPATGQLTDHASGTTTSNDPISSNNDGSSPAASVTTVIVPAPPPNRPPVIGNTSDSTVANVPLYRLLAFSDPDPGQVVQIEATTPPGFGTVQVSSDGSYRYVPQQDFTGRDSFGVRACDNGSPQLCTAATVTVLVLPVASDSTQTIDQGTTLVMNVSANDIGTTGAATIVLPTTNGAITVLADGTVRYVPDPAFVGTDLFRYSVCSVQSADVCVSAQVTINVVALPNRQPSAEDIALATQTGRTVSGRITATDPDASQTLTATLAAGPAAGSAVVQSDGTVAYTPSGQFSGRDQFTVSFCDDGSPSKCAIGTVRVNVSPSAADDASTTKVDTPVSIEVGANDAGTVGAPSIASSASHGTTTVEADHTITYRPANGYTGSDTFTYEICSVPDTDLCDTARVTVQVDALPNHAPVLGGQTQRTTVSVPVGGQLVGADADAGQSLTYSAASTPAHGTVTVSAAGAYTYTETDTFVGRDSFQVKVCDDATTPLCATATVSIDIFPIASAASTALNVNSVVTVVPSIVGDVGAPSVATQPGHGTASATPGGILYTPDPGFVGLDSFTYSACDAASGTYCDSSLVALVVDPILINDAVTTLAGQKVVATVEANDIGTLGPPVIITPPANGSAVIGSSIDYTPTGAFTGHDTVGYQRCSPVSPTVCGIATLSIRVLPDTRDDSASTVDGVPVTIDVNANDVGDAESATIFRPPTNGDLTLESDGRITYTPTGGFIGTDSFTYQRCSLGADQLCSLAVVSIDITAAPPTPVPPTPPAPTPIGPAPTPSFGVDPIAIGPDDGSPGTGGDDTLATTGPTAPIDALLEWALAFGVAGLLALGSATVLRRRRR
ncbi:uncharacterized protein DUF11 [Jatrophihabitans sp. GAS493]|uniref:Ig-like domain-containing protein n=1 Tax=Jatrophihabitans sp. GAS493 TaxID=1907575 RepID=UPI000BC03333|nr:Ig-like domain-containing protein [Jatrophihabitans sp. GAS493]SOD71910.1 uncharacterized protein DUF11 [Jatrophihabitans sp. GAS493]